MVTHERDEFERMADFYNNALPTEMQKLQEILTTVIADETPLSYSQFLRLKQQFEAVAQTMHRRDMFGVHSDTGRAKFRHIAHPEQFPAPAEAALV